MIGTLEAPVRRICEQIIRDCSPDDPLSLLAQSVLVLEQRILRLQASMSDPSAARTLRRNRKAREQR